VTSQLQVFMHAERIQESGDNYRAYNVGSGAGGAYQFEPPTWRGALRGAGLGSSPYMNMGAQDAPPAIQDAAAAWLMGGYYQAFGHSWYNVAEAWYGGPGAVGHPGRGGGPGYPNVGQYASQVMAIYDTLLLFGEIGGGPPAPPDPSGGAWTSAERVWQWMDYVYGHSLSIDNTSISQSGSF
jgi:hypothetical protein